MADERRVSDTQPYELGVAGTLILSVTIGERQVGGTALRLNGAIVPFPDQQASVRIPVGTPPSVLDCVTLVEDVNPASNRTSVIFTVAGDRTPEGAKTVIAAVGLAFNFSEKRYDFVAN